MKKTPHILVSSVDPWSKRVGSDTLSSLLSQFNSEDVASVNIRAQKSDSPVAGQYFQIIEGRVIKSILKPSLKTGGAYRPVEEGREGCDECAEEEKNRYSKKRILSRWFYVLSREIVWKLGHWKSDELDNFVDTFAPDVFFFPIENYIHFNRINQYIINKFHPHRVIGYMWDDNFTFKQHPFNPLYIIHRIWLRRSVKQLVKRCDVVFAINPKLKKELDAEYGINSVLLTKPIKQVETPTFSSVEYPIRMIYTGKLIIGRDETIAKIVEAIRKVNSKGPKVILDVYTGTALSTKMKGRIDVPGACNLHGFISQEEVIKEQQKSDVLIFAESLTNQDLSARLSFSTKITDYLSAGKCIWAIGSKDLAPIEYLKTEDAAIVSCMEHEIEEHLRTIVDHKEIIVEYAQKGLECGKRNHNASLIERRFREAIFG